MLGVSDPTIVTSGMFDRFEDAQDYQEEVAALGNGASTSAPAPAEAEAEVPPQPAPPRPERIQAPFPRPLRTRAVRGRYRGASGNWRLELRVDVDGERPTRRVSGDFFSTSGSTTGYFGSFVVHAPTITTKPAHVLIEGTGSFTWRAAAPKIRLRIPRVPAHQPQRPATLEFRTASDTAGSAYQCTYESRYFRTVSYEEDSVTGTVPFVSYDTASLPQPAGSPARVLTVPKALAEAGIELLTTGAANVIPTSAAGANATWSDSELHAAMVNHFSRFTNAPRWQVWMLVAGAHDGGYRGIMFDYEDAFQRQGAAVFYDAIKGTDAASRRSQLRTYVHELGHAFNLMHSWQKDLAVPPAPLGPNGGLADLSWMNYDWKYQQSPSGPGGASAYWASFPFQFTENELVHLRHGYYRNVIMGANAFSSGAADIDPDLFDDPVQDASGLALELRSPKPAFAFGEPVVVELKLSGTELRDRETHGYLHPNDDLVSVAVQQPSGRTRLFRPLLRHCVDTARTVTLGVGRPALYESAYLGFGRDGFLFETPGTYRIRASYVAGDGSRVLSPVLRLRVRPPATGADEIVGELLLGEEQGQLLALLGSDAATLRGGMTAIDTLVDEHPDHPLAVYGRLAKGINELRDFKELTADKTLRVRPAHGAEAAQLLARVVEDSVADTVGVDNITLNMALRAKARAEAKAGDLGRAVDTTRDMVRMFEGKHLNPLVLDDIRAQAEATWQEIGADDGENGHRSSEA
ncbi:hypothetical protein [Prauserella muralis]|uniref:Uncharacterized protein n=1 Tax=Prauserella muralis TaxID=588067 RepID=A0A2V4B8D2_9PSEU|nr:hypothetical protein [Prauserella muralis]PXY31311.1 hypothetical protein BAY60_02635 [Prauserella muralis]TWE14371.1 hypothetical protein FHX69_6516 [Prauserella muralis]